MVQTNDRLPNNDITEGAEWTMDRRIMVELPADCEKQLHGNCSQLEGGIPARGWDEKRWTT